VGAKVLYGHKNDKIIILNKKIQKMCSNFSLTYIDLNKEILSENGVLIDAYTNGNLYLLGTACLVWKEAIITSVDE
jgi:hypothetical protein